MSERVGIHDPAQHLPAEQHAQSHRSATQHSGFITLSFDHPGKARRRTPDNWAEFAPHIIRLKDDRWTSEPLDKSGNSRGKVSPSRKLFHDALLDAIAHAGTRPGETTRADWEAECLRRDLIPRFEPDDDKQARDKKRAALVV